MSGPDAFDDWIGRQRVTRDTITLERARKLAATLDRDPSDLAPGALLPRGWHWIYFHEPVRRSALADDGHESRGDFLPPVPLPRRMWAGGRLRFLRSVLIGSTLRRTSTVRSIDLKEGRSGRLAFVTVEHRLADADGTVLDEEQDLVYLERRSEPWTPPPKVERPESVASGEAEARRLETRAADEVTLFRFSALTFNGHRIHYDRSFAEGVEGYPDLVVHGPLVALLLLGAGCRWLAADDSDAAQEAPVHFEYRARQPVFCNEAIELYGAVPARPGAGPAKPGARRTIPGRDPTDPDSAKALELWAEHPDRGVITEAELQAGI